jgi:hypothetical protein
VRARSTGSGSDERRVRRLLFLIVAVGALWGAPGAFAAGWCGSGESTTDRADVVTGRQVHAIYAVPSDGADTFATGVQTLASDIDSITTWWQGQDATRVPRWDTATFPGGTCADISFVRLPRPGAEYASGASRGFQLVSGDLFGANFDSPYKKYVVYYNGPSVQEDVCGTGTGDSETGPSYAVVWLQGCPGTPTDGIAAHEFLHALGALPFGAPHACPGDPAHPCDSSRDVLYPFNDGEPLAADVLDFNHDDYYAHSGSWLDMQDSQWLHVLLPPVALQLTIAGPGSVASDVPGLACTATCTTQWDPGSQLDLAAFEHKGSRFVRWQGACTTTDPGGCALTMGASKAVTAVFGPARIAVTVAATGKGIVKCTPRCSRTFAAGSALTLRAVPAKGWRFSRWSGACKGTSPVCRPKTDFSLSARATFRRR